MYVCLAIYMERETKVIRFEAEMTFLSMLRGLNSHVLCM